MYKSLILTLMLLGTVLLAGCPSSVPAPSPELKDITVPNGVTLIGLQCGAPCAIYWDPEHSQYVMAFADGRVVTVEQRG